MSDFSFGSLGIQPSAPPASGGSLFHSLGVLPGSTPPGPRAAQDIGDALRAGFQSSSMGLMLRGKMPDVALGEDAPWHMRLASGIGNIAGDLVPGAGGAIVGSIAGTAVAPGPGTLIGGGAGAFGAPMAIRDALIRAYENNYATTWEGVLDIGWAALKGGGKGSLIGGTTMGAGALAARGAGAVLAPGLTTTVSVPAARATITTAGVGAELSTLTGGMAALEGKMPTWQDFMDNALLLGGVKAAVGVAKGMRNIYAQTGKTPAEQVLDAQRDPKLALDLKPLEAPSTEPAVTAYHGTPHQFEKFDASKIGTGEGAQTYGRGLYFAENRSVAETYSQMRDGSNPLRDTAKTYLSDAGGDPKKAAAALKEYVDYENTTGAKRADADALLREIEAAARDVNLYKVEIPKSVVDKMLDWDAPIEQQPAAVQAVLKELARETNIARGIGENSTSAILRKAFALGLQAEERLQAAGVTGIKYFDAGSRNDGAQAAHQLYPAQFPKPSPGTRNMVLFDAQHARVIERNGETIGSPRVAANPIPEAYRTLALEERVKAALDTDQRPALVKAIMDEMAGKPDPAAARDLVRYEYITDRETFDSVVRAVVDTYAKDIEVQRRDVVPNKQSLAEGAEMLKAGALDAHKVGEAANAGEAAARAFLVRGSAERVKQLAAEFDATPLEARSVGQQLQLHAAIEQVGIFYGQLAGGVAEAARTLQLMGQLKRNPALLGDAQMLLEAYNAKGKDLGSLTGMLRSMTDPQQMAKFASELQNATGMQKILEVYRANLFSGFLTHIANPLGNFTKWIVDIPESALAATLHAAGKAMTGDPLTMAQWKARAFAPLIGWQLGAKDGVIAAMEVFTQKQQVLDKVEVMRLANGGKIGAYTGTVFRALQAEDMFFRVPAERAQAYILAVDRAIKEGFNPNTTEGQQAVSRYTNQPQYGLTLAEAQKVTTKIEQAGSEAVFAQNLGKINAGIQHAISGSAAQFIIPAYRTPANLLSWAVQHTPGMNFLSARWRADFAAGGERTAQATARVVIGTGLAMTAYALADAGILTGSGIYDKEQSGTKRAAGWQPNSVKLGDTYYSFERIEPVAKVLTMAADLIELGRVTKDEEDKGKIAMMLIAGFGNATISTTYMSGLANFLKAVTDPQKQAENWIEGYAASLVPKAIGQLVTAADPYKREIDGVLDAIQGQLPFVREKLLAKVDVWGTPVQNNRWFDVMPITTTEASKDLVRTEAMRLQLAIVDAPRMLMESGPFKQKDRDIKLTPEQRDVMRQVTGTEAMKILSPIVNAPDWKQIPDFAQAEIYRQVIAGTRKQGAFAALPAEAVERQKMQQRILDKIIQQTQAVNK